MKKKVFLPSTITVIIIVIIACTKQDNSELVPLPRLPDVVFGEGARIGSLKLPDYTTITSIESGFIFHFPENYYLAYYDTNDELVIADEGEYGCKCEEGTGGCQPFFHPAFGFGCAQSTCTGSCVGRFIEQSVLSTGIVINLKDSFRIIRNEEEANSTFKAKEVLFDIDFVQDKIKEINLKYYGKEVLTDEDLINTNFKKVTISLYGNLVIYAMPVEFLDSKDELGDPTCACNPVMEDDCVEAVKKKGIWYCKNEACQDCILTPGGGVESGGN